MNTTVCALCEAIRWAPCSTTCTVLDQSPVVEDRQRAGEQEEAA